MTFQQLSFFLVFACASTESDMDVDEPFALDAVSSTFPTEPDAEISLLKYETCGGSAFAAWCRLLYKCGQYQDNDKEMELIGNLPGSTALHIAALHGHVRAVRVLLQRGASTSLVNSCARTPLILAAMRGHEDVVRMLLDNGASTMPCDLIGQDASEWAEVRGFRQVANKLRTAAVTEGQRRVREAQALRKMTKAGGENGSPTTPQVQEDPKQVAEKAMAEAKAALEKASAAQKAATAKRAAVTEAAPQVEPAAVLVSAADERSRMTPAQLRAELRAQSGEAGPTTTAAKGRSPWIGMFSTSFSNGSASRAEIQRQRVAQARTDAHEASRGEGGAFSYSAKTRGTLPDTGAAKAVYAARQPVSSRRWTPRASSAMRWTPRSSRTPSPVRSPNFFGGSPTGGTTSPGRTSPSGGKQTPASEAEPVADGKELSARRRRHDRSQYMSAPVTDPSRFAFFWGGTGPAEGENDMSGSLSTREFVSPYAPTTRSIGTTMVDSMRDLDTDPFRIKERNYKMVVSARKRNWMTSRRRWVDEKTDRALTAKESAAARSRLYASRDRPPPRVYT